MKIIVKFMAAYGVLGWVALFYASVSYANAPRSGLADLSQNLIDCDSQSDGVSLGRAGEVPSPDWAEALSVFEQNHSTSSTAGTRASFVTQFNLWFQNEQGTLIPIKTTDRLEVCYCISGYARPVGLNARPNSPPSMGAIERWCDNITSVNEINVFKWNRAHEGPVIPVLPPPGIPLVKITKVRIKKNGRSYSRFHSDTGYLASFNQNRTPKVLASVGFAIIESRDDIAAQEIHSRSLATGPAVTDSRSPHGGLDPRINTARNPSATSAGTP